MSQNSLVLPTSGTLPGLAAVQGVNAALDTLNTLASGASGPSTPAAGQLWHDTANGVLKLRSMDNTSWIALFQMDETNYAARVAPMPSLYGLQLSNDTSTPNTVLDVTAGGAIDLTATYFVKIGAFKKNLGAAWVAGSGNGGLDTGSLAANSGYHLHLIYNPNTRTADCVASLSCNAPALQSGWVEVCAIGAVTTDGSAHIRPFAQNGNEFLYTTPVPDVNNVLPTTSPTLTNLSVPNGLRLNALFRATLISSYNGGAPNLLFQSPDETAATASLQNASLGTGIPPAGGSSLDSGDFNVRVNTAGQIRVSSDIANSGIGYYLSTRGFIYPRGLT